MTRIKRHNTETVELSVEEALSLGMLDPDGAVIEQNVEMARSVLAAAGHDLAYASLLLDGSRNNDPKWPDVPNVAPVETIDRELVAQIVRHGEGMARVLGRADTPQMRRELLQMRYHALHFMKAVYDAQQLDPKSGRPPKVTRALIDEVERLGEWSKVDLMVEEIARRADVDPSNVWKALAARKRK